MRPIQRMWEYVQQHRIWSGVVASVMAALVIGLGAFFRGQLDDLWAQNGPETSIFSFSGTDPRYEDLPRVSGDCWTVGLASLRLDSWRCITDTSRIHDPCFSKESAVDNAEATAVCPGDPRGPEDDVVMVFDGTDVDWEERHAFVQRVESVMNLPAPWFFAVGDLGCFRITGTAPYSGLATLPFGCAADETVSDTATTTFCTEPEEAGITWQTRCLDVLTTSKAVPLTISSLWY